MSISDMALDESGKKKTRKKSAKSAAMEAATETDTEKSELPDEEMTEGSAEQASTADGADSNECDGSAPAQPIPEAAEDNEDKTAADEDEATAPQDTEEYENETFDFVEAAITDGGEEAAEGGAEAASLPEDIETEEGKSEASDGTEAEYENETFDFGDGEVWDTGDEEAEDTKPEQAPQEKSEWEKYNPEKPRKADTRFDILEIFTFTLVAIILVTSFLFRHSVVEGGSMLNTLSDGDHLIITDLFYTPKRYDIVVFEDFSTGFDKALIKRVIATEGEVVRITVEGEVFVDGERIRDDFVHICHYNPDRPFEYTVGEGEVFVMGDHRCCSTDSRDFGAIREDSILGKVVLRFYPFPSFGTVD